MINPLKCVSGFCCPLECMICSLRERPRNGVRCCAFELRLVLKSCGRQVYVLGAKVKALVDVVLYRRFELVQSAGVDENIHCSVAV